MTLSDGVRRSSIPRRSPSQLGVSITDRFRRLSLAGHGFKFGPLVGKLLCELSQGEEPSHDLSPFRIARFHEIKSSL